MLKLFYKAKRLKKEQRGSPVAVYGAVLSIVLCMICLAGTSWAWFTANQTATVDGIATTSYAVDVTISGNGYTEGSHEGNMRFYTLTANNSYTVTLTPSQSSTASTGYCLIAIGDTVYYTSPITQQNSFTFTYQTGVAVPDGLTKTEYENLLANTAPTKLTVAWYWGTYPNTQNVSTYDTDPGYIPLENGVVLGTAPGETPLDTELVLDLTDFDLPETEDVIPLGEDYDLVLTPGEDYELPEYIVVEIDDTAYEVYTDGLEHREIPVDEEDNPDPKYLDENGEPDLSLLPPMPTFDPETNTLTIPAILLTEEVQSVSIRAAAVKIICTCETRCTERNENCPVCKDNLEGCLGTESEETDPTETTEPTEEPVTTEPPATTEPSANSEPAATDPTATTAATEPPITTEPVTTDPPATTEPATEPTTTPTESDPAEETQ